MRSLLLIAWLVVVAGARGYLQLRRTGDPGVAFHDRRGSPQWWARLISMLGLGCAFAAPIVELAGLTPAAPRRAGGVARVCCSSP